MAIRIYRGRTIWRGAFYGTHARRSWGGSYQDRNPGTGGGEDVSRFRLARHRMATTESQCFQTLIGNKKNRSSLDLKRRRWSRAVRSVGETAECCVQQSCRGVSLPRLAIDYRHLKAINPKSCARSLIPPLWRGNCARGVARLLII